MSGRENLGRQFRPERLVGKRTCIHCDEPSDELNWQDECPTCEENKRFDGGYRG